MTTSRPALWGAGHNVEVLRRIYSKILDGFDETWIEGLNRTDDLFITREYRLGVNQVLLHCLPG
jgi:hypothetical protein